MANTPPPRFYCFLSSSQFFSISLVEENNRNVVGGSVGKKVECRVDVGLMKGRCGVDVGLM